MHREIRVVENLTRPKLSSEQLRAASERLEPLGAEATLAWALEQFPGRLVVASSFGGPTSMVVLDMLLRLDASVPVSYVDTGLLFDETYRLVETVAARYGVTPIPVRPALTVAEQAERHGDALWARDPDRCCSLRKVEPQRAFLDHYDAWITGLRRDQSSTRSVLDVVARDRQFGLVKVNPLAGWDERKVWTYIHKHDVPYNALNDRGFPSVGCTPCTRAIASGEDLRAGRWSEHGKTECGLHAALTSASL